MKFKNNKWMFFHIAALLTFGMMSLGTTLLVQAADKIIKIDGSSTVYPITEAVAEEFQIEKKGDIRVTVGISGTGGGFKKFCRDEIDLSGASRPIKAKEMAACKEAGIQYVELPVAYDALTVVVHPKNNWANKLTTEDLKKIWQPEAQGKITKWSQVNSKWPNEEIKLYGPGSDSGTFDYFTEAIVGKSGSSRGDYTASEDDNVLVQGVANDKYALGYFGYAYYLENKNRVQAVAINNGKSFVLPNEESVESGTYAPLSRPVFIYVAEKSAKKPEVKEFVDFYLTNAPDLVSEVGYVALPASAYEKAKSRFQKLEVGTAFGGGSDVGLSIEEVLNRKPKI